MDFDGSFSAYGSRACIDALPNELLYDILEELVVEEVDLLVTREPPVPDSGTRQHIAWDDTIALVFDSLSPLLRAYAALCQSRLFASLQLDIQEPLEGIDVIAIAKERRVVLSTSLTCCDAIGGRLGARATYRVWETYWHGAIVGLYWDLAVLCECLRRRLLPMGRDTQEFEDGLEEFSKVFKVMTKAETSVLSVLKTRSPRSPPIAPWPNLTSNMVAQSYILGVLDGLIEADFAPRVTAFARGCREKWAMLMPALGLPSAFDAPGPCPTAGILDGTVMAAFSVLRQADEHCGWFVRELQAEVSPAYREEMKRALRAKAAEVAIIRTRVSPILDEALAIDRASMS